MSDRIYQAGYRSGKRQGRAEVKAEVQAIADAWNELPGGQCYAVRIAAGKLVAAIEDALIEEER